MTMRIRGLTRSGHWPTLLTALVYFDVSFMVWVLLGALGVYISADLGLGPADKGLLVAMPILSGSVLRVALGLLADRFGGRRVGMAGMVATLLPLLLAWRVADSLGELLLVGALLGVAGASFAVALPLAGRWYPPEHQGLILGLAAAGNSGTVIATLAAPRLAESLGWHAVFGVACLPVLVALVFFALAARESPQHRLAGGGFRRYAALFGDPEAWRLALLYMVSFGGFVGLGSFLPIFLVETYGTSRVSAGDWTALAVLAGSIARPAGGYVADRLGGVRVLAALLPAAGLLLLGVAGDPPLPLAGALLFGTLGTLGMANGAVFQLVGARLSQALGAATGLIGAAGGVGGFLLPSLLGLAKHWTGSFAVGIILFAVAALAAGVSLALLGARERWVERDLEVAEEGAPARNTV